MIRFLEREIQPALFKDRVDAGRKLGERLKDFKDKNPVVLAIPSGGVPVGIEVARTLSCPFDLIIVRKIQFPWTTEAGFGAIASDGTLFLGREAREVSKEVIEKQTKKALNEVKRREKEFLKGRKRIDISGKTAILVDDGIAAGSSMVAAARYVKKKKPKMIIVAAPTASAGAVKLVKKEADEVITLYTHPENLPFAVASSYEKWHDLTDEEVKTCLKNGSF